VTGIVADRDLSVGRARRDLDRLALVDDVIASAHRHPHRARDHLQALGLLWMDVALGEERPRAPDHIHLEQLGVGLLGRPAHFNADT
jgi:hypothetical protein